MTYGVFVTALQGCNTYILQANLTAIFSVHENASKIKFCCSLGCWIKGSNCVLFLDNAQLPYLEVYNALFVYNALLQMGLLFMCPIIVQPNANVYSYTSRKHLWCSSPCGVSCDNRQDDCCKCNVIKQSRNKGQVTVWEVSTVRTLSGTKLLIFYSKTERKAFKDEASHCKFPLAIWLLNTSTIQVLVHACWSCFWAAAAIDTTKRLKSLLSRLYKSLKQVLWQ